MSFRRRVPYILTLERLELRRLLASTSPFHADINFQPAASAVPAGYDVDSGAIFGDRGNGLSYGWNFDDSANTRDRNSKLSPDRVPL